MATITIPKSITKGEELVVISRREYERFFRLSQEIRETLAKVERGRREYRTGKTYTVNSPRELLSK